MRKRSWISCAAALALSFGAGSQALGQVYFSGQFGAGNTWNVYELRGIGTLSGFGRFRFEGGETVVTGPGLVMRDAHTASIGLTESISGTNKPGHLLAMSGATAAAENAFIVGKIAFANTEPNIGLTDDEFFGGLESREGPLPGQEGAQQSGCNPCTGAAGKGFQGNGQGWVWTNGEPYDFQNWNGTGEPNDYANSNPPTVGQGEDATVLLTNGLWNDDGDGDGFENAPARSYVVEYETRLPAEPSLPPLPVLGTVAQKTPGPLSTQDGRMAIREIINNGDVSGNTGAINALFRGPGNPSAIIRDYLSPTLNLSNAAGEGSGGRFGGATQKDFGVVLAGDVTNTEDLALRATGRFVIPAGQGGVYTFQLTSDDSAEMWIYGKTFGTPTNGEVTSYGSLRFAGDRGDANTLGQVTLEPGEYDFEFVFNENGGGAGVELGAAKGAFTAFDPAAFELVGAAKITNYNATIPRVVGGWQVEEVIQLPERFLPGGTDPNPARDTDGDLDSLAKAKNLLANPDEDDDSFSGTVASLNMADPDAAGGGSYGGNIAFLNDLPTADDNDFVFSATGNLEITTAGLYSFYFDSDDGGELSIDGASFTVVTSNVGANAVISEDGDTLTMDVNTGSTGTLVTTQLSAGIHPISVLMWENAGGAFVELAMAPGEFDTFDARLFAPIGDTVQQLSVNTPGGLQLVKQATAQVGDTDNDGDVDITDLNNVRNNFSGTGLGDTDGDNDIDITDLNNVRNNFGATPGGANAVPEPSSIVLVGLGLVGLLAARRFRKN